MATQKSVRDKLLSVFLDDLNDSGTERVKGGELSFGKNEIIHMIKGFAVGIVSAIFGLSPGVFSCYPFGIALLSASDKYIPYCAGGLLISSLFSGAYAFCQLAVYVIILLLRFAVCKLSAQKGISDGTKNKKSFILGKIFTPSFQSVQMFCEPVIIRCTVAAFAAFVFGMYRLIAGGFLYYDLFGLCAGFIISPVSALSLIGIFTKEEKYLRYRSLSAGALIFIFVFCLRGTDLFGFNPAYMAAVIVTLYAASKSGAMKGSAVGIVMGLASATGIWGDFFVYSLGGSSFLIAVIGITFGYLWKLSGAAAVFVSCVASITAGTAIDGYGVMPRLIPDILTAYAIFLPLVKFGLFPKLDILDEDKTDSFLTEVAISRRRQKDERDSTRTLSDAFQRLSETVYLLSDHTKRPGVIDIKQICIDAFDEYCAKCSLTGICWERECTSTLDAQSKLISTLHKGGRLSDADMPDFLKKRCRSYSQIIDKINHKTAKHIENLIKGDKTEAFALDYDAISKLLSHRIAEKECEYKVDKDLTERLKTTLTYSGMTGVQAVCFGKRKKQIFVNGIDICTVKLGANDLRTSIENTIGTKMTQPEYKVEDGVVSMQMCSSRRFKIEGAKASGKKKNEKDNGDSMSMFENREDYYYALVSDGMGSGRDAAVTSKICAYFIEQMLAGGNSKAITIEMLNGFIRGRGIECSATIDLVEIDLITGEASFVKSGAAPSFILRGGNLYKLQSRTAPIGIMKNPDAEKIKFDLELGDVIVMISDGIASSLEDGIWLTNLLTYEWNDNLSLMADKIIENALYSSERSDDMSVCLLRVGEFSEEYSA